MRLYNITPGLFLRGHTRRLDPEVVVVALREANVGRVVCVAPTADAALRARLKTTDIAYEHVPFADGALVPEHVLVPLTRRLADELKTTQRGVLVHCNAGRNRGALVAAMVLVRLGWTADAALAQVRRVRPGALANTAFADYLASGCIW
jgi:protein-tyrosine phosphatase